MKFPQEIIAFQQRPLEDIQKTIDELADRPLTSNSIDQWLKDWRNLAILFQETYARLDIATDLDTQDTTLTQKRDAFRQTLMPLEMQLHQKLNQRLEDNRPLLPSLFDVSLRYSALGAKMDAVAPKLLDLFNEEAQLAGKYNSIRGAQTVEHNGETLTMSALHALQSDPDRATREQTWKISRERRYEDKAEFDALWKKLLTLRQKIAQDGGFDNYLDFRFMQMERFDYTPEDSLTMHDLFAEIVVPAATHAFQQKQAYLKLDTLRPWDVDAPLTDEPIRPFTSVQELTDKSSRVFHRIDPEFGEYFDSMIDNELIDLDDRPHKGAAGGFIRAIGDKGCFLFMKVAGAHRDVENMMHEMGHAFAMRQSFNLPYLQVMFPVQDFSETPSMTMELLSMPFWDEFYPPEQLKIVQLQSLYHMLFLWCDYPLFDAFQHWAYRNPQDALNPDNCDRKWGELVQRYNPFVDWTGLESYRDFGWRDNMLIFAVPLMDMEYAFGQLAGIHLWQEAKQDLRGAIARYKQAIGLGRTVTVPELFAALHTPFPIQPADLQNATDYLANELAKLQAELP